MIARSDLFILVVSASLLAVGIVRWQQNMSNITLASSTAQSSQNSPAVNATTTQPTIGQSATAAAGTNTLTRSATQADTVQPQFGQTATDTTTGPSGAAQSNVGIAASTNGIANQANEPLYGIYVVQSGDFLGRIATTYGTSVNTLREINNISGSLIEIGQEIKYPLPAN